MFAQNAGLVSPQASRQFMSWTEAGHSLNPCSKVIFGRHYCNRIGGVGFQSAWPALSTGNLLLFCSIFINRIYSGARLDSVLGTFRAGLRPCWCAEPKTRQHLCRSYPPWSWQSSAVLQQPNEAVCSSRTTHARCCQSPTPGRAAARACRTAQMRGRVSSAQCTEPALPLLQPRRRRVGPPASARAPALPPQPWQPQQRSQAAQAPSPPHQPAGLPPGPARAATWCVLWCWAQLGSPPAHVYPLSQADDRDTRPL